MLNLKVETTAVELKSKTKHGVDEHDVLETTASELGTVLRKTP